MSVVTMNLIANIVIGLLVVFILFTVGRSMWRDHQMRKVELETWEAAAKKAREIRKQLEESRPKR